MQSDMAVLQQFITLTLPMMEDGGNWGVSIQLQGLKHITDLNDKLDKLVDDIYKYNAARADALDKCQLESSSSVTTETKSTSDSNGTSTEKGENKTKNESTSTETKKTTTAAGSASLTLEYRHRALVAVDVLYYTKTKALFQQCLTGYMGVIDFMDKNAEKVAAPKGSSGGSSFSGMY